MRRAAATLVLALSPVGCTSVGLNVESEPISAAPTDAPDGAQVPLLTVETQKSCCWLLYWVVDVAADPTVGTVDKATGTPLKWPTGYAGWRVLAKVSAHTRWGAR